MPMTAARFFAADPKEIWPAQEDSFFNELRTNNATYKTTAHDRFADLDAACIALLRQSARPIREVLDIGVSSGTTTLALYDRLREAGIDARVTGTDRSVSGHLVRVLPGVRTLLDDGGAPIQHDLFGLPVRPWFRRADRYTGMRGVRSALNATLGGRARRLVAAGASGASAVRLVSPRLAERPRVTIECNDIFAPTAAYHRRFDLVRVANLLHPGYFSVEQLRLGIAHTVSYLSGPGAWLLLARTLKRRHVATLFRVSDDGARLEIADRFNGGAEAEWLALEAPLPAWDK